MRGETVMVQYRTVSGRDEAGNEQFDFSAPVEFNDVLFAPASTTNLPGDNQPNGISVPAKLAFPRNHPPGNLRGARITLRGEQWHVIGDPQFADGGMQPTRWNLAVDIEREDG